VSVRAAFVVISRPVPGREDEFNTWYDEVHLPEVCAVPGFVGARRYRRSASADDGMPDYLAVYDIVAEDPAACVADLVNRSRAGELKLHDALQMDPPPLTGLYEARGTVEEER
jgi:hypothetical protein